MHGPRWIHSIRFRLSLFFALAMFTSGSLLIGGIYMWQLERLDQPGGVRHVVVVLRPRRAHDGARPRRRGSWKVTRNRHPPPAFSSVASKTLA